MSTMNIRAPLALGGGDQTVTPWPDVAHDYEPRYLLPASGSPATITVTGTQYGGLAVEFICHNLGGNSTRYTFKDGAGVTLAYFAGPGSGGPAHTPNCFVRFTSGPVVNQWTLDVMSASSWDSVNSAPYGALPP